MQHATNMQKLKKIFYRIPRPDCLLKKLNLDNQLNVCVVQVAFLNTNIIYYSSCYKNYSAFYGRIFYFLDKTRRNGDGTK